MTCNHNWQSTSYANDTCTNCFETRGKSDSGQLSSFALPLAVAAIAMYLMHFMAAHGILQSLTMLAK